MTTIELSSGCQHWTAGDPTMRPLFSRVETLVVSSLLLGFVVLGCSRERYQCVSDYECMARGAFLDALDAIADQGLNADVPSVDRRVLEEQLVLVKIYFDIGNTPLNDAIKERFTLLRAMRPEDFVFTFYDGWFSVSTTTQVELSDSFLFKRVGDRWVLHEWYWERNLAPPGVR